MFSLTILNIKGNINETNTLIIEYFTAKKGNKNNDFSIELLAPNNNIEKKLTIK